ncbi:MAG: T9SS type A sorting domain-containing protein, partial [Flavobacteriaceae bacterium]|nr:T9SS type A sorting domain-containing protein [Flavobacteriaceae bacterium]
VGQKIKSGSLLQGNNEINVKRLIDGVYFLNFFIENKTYSRKIIIKK